MPYGRLVRDADGALREIVEAADATAEQLEIQRAERLDLRIRRRPTSGPRSPGSIPRNAQGELYLTDTIAHLARAAGRRSPCSARRDPALAEGVNTRVELAQAAALLRDRVNERHMLAGVTIVDPQTTWIEPDVELEADATVHPFTVLRGRTRVAAGAEIGPHAVAPRRRGRARCDRGTLLLPSPRHGPRGGREGGHVRGDQELARRRGHQGAPSVVPRRRRASATGRTSPRATSPPTSRIEPGQPKGRTTIGRNVRTGIHNGFIAPVTIGDDAWIAAGSVITKDVPAEALAVARSRQVNKEGYAGRDGDD